MNIEGIEIGAGHPCRFVAEMSNAHNGSFQRALRIIETAKSAGADMIKMQCYTPDELVTLRGDGPAPDPWGAQGWTMRTLYERAQTPLEWFPRLFARARKIGIVPFSSVFGAESLACLEAVESPAYKIARLDCEHRDLAEAVCESAYQRGAAVLVSSHRRSGAHQAKRHPRTKNWALLYCPPGYPTPLSQVVLPMRFQERNINSGNGFIGLSSHCLDPIVAVAAVVRGCKLIEMHMMLADEPSELEANVSLNQYQFKQMVHDVRRTEEMLG